MNEGRIIMPQKMQALATVISYNREHGAICLHALKGDAHDAFQDSGKKEGGRSDIQQQRKRQEGKQKAAQNRPEQCGKCIDLYNDAVCLHQLFLRNKQGNACLYGGLIKRLYDGQGYHENGNQYDAEALCAHHGKAEDEKGRQKIQTEHDASSAYAICQNTAEGGKQNGR